jgi:serine/threonine protein phosphatase PrpC
MKFQYAATTHVGGRSHNEDAYCVEPRLGLFAVADGMGGYEGGEVASRITVHTVHAVLATPVPALAVGAPGADTPPAAFPLPHAERVAAAARAANDAVVAQRKGKLAQMGSTLALLSLRGHEAVVAHVGDSRVYRLRAGALEQLTRDHSLLEEMRAMGWSPPPEGSEGPSIGHIITRAIGLQGGTQPDVATHGVQAGDVFMLCSDGLYGPLPDEVIAGALAASTAGDACARLIEAALERETSDNATVVVVRALG